MNDWPSFEKRNDILSLLTAIFPCSIGRIAHHGKTISNSHPVLSGTDLTDTRSLLVHASPLLLSRSITGAPTIKAQNYDSLTPLLLLSLLLFPLSFRPWSWIPIYLLCIVGYLQSKYRFSFDRMNSNHVLLALIQYGYDKSQMAR